MSDVTAVGLVGVVLLGAWGAWEFVKTHKMMKTQERINERKEDEHGPNRSDVP